MRRRALALLCLAAAACGADEPADRCEPVVEYVRLPERPGVALLLVVDESEAMAPAQRAVAEQLSELLAGLVRGDSDGDGVRDTQPVDGMKIGVVTTEMGTRGFDVPGCEPDLGDDGILHRPPECGETSPPFLRYPPPDGAEPTRETVACLTDVGTDGCPYPQPLESALKAITPSSDPLTFADGTIGHGELNEDFFSNTIDVIVVLSDRDDCSVADPGLFDPASDSYEGDAAGRCTGYPSALHTIDRYAEGFLAAAVVPHYMLYGVIAGIPPELATSGPGIDYDAILDAPEMQVRRDPSGPSGLAASCTTDAGFAAVPPRRLVTTAREVAAAGGDVVLGSVCEPGLAQAFRALGARIARAHDAGCIPRWARDPDGLVDCTMIETIFARVDARCEDAPGLEPLGVDPDGNVLCRVNQLAVRDGAVEPGDGWFVDDFSDDAERLCPTSAALWSTPSVFPQAGATYRIECAPDAVQGALYPGSSCPSPDAVCTEGESLGDALCAYDLACDPRTHTMRVPCAALDGERACVCHDGFCEPFDCRTTPAG